jgi:hypothetical protein
MNAKKLKTVLVDVVVWNLWVNLCFMHLRRMNFSRETIMEKRLPNVPLMDVFKESSDKHNY